MAGLPHKRFCISFYEALYWPLPLSLSLFLSFTLILLPLCISVGMAGQGWKVSGVQACLQCSAPSLAEFGEAREACVCLLSVLECMGSGAYTYWESAVDRQTHTYTHTTQTQMHTHTHARTRQWLSGDVKHCWLL